MADEKSMEQQASGMWGWFLFTGLLWVLIAFMILRFDLESAIAVGILVGVVAAHAAGEEDEQGDVDHLDPPSVP